MSRSSRALHRARAGLGDTTPVTRVRGPADVATMVPYLLGFQPVESLVMVALLGPRRRFGPVLRLDLVDDPAVVRKQARQILTVTRANAIDRVLLAAFSAEPSRADPLMALVRDMLAEQLVEVEDAFRTDGTRWWSYTCGDPSCCSPDGTPYDVGASRVAAEAVLSGMTFATDREALRDLFAPAPAERRLEVEQEVSRLRRTDPTVRPVVVEATLGARVSRLLESEAELTPGDAAWLALALQSFRGQDAALALVERTSAAAHFELWRTVMCLVVDDLLAPVGCLAAFSAWLDGRGVLASHAVERVLDVAPQHPMALRLYGLLADAVNPRTWSGQIGSS